MIAVENLDVHYGDLQVLWDVSLEVQDDESIVAIVGPNGAGKTTLLKSLSKVIDPTAGRIEILGHETVRSATESKSIQQRLNARLRQIRGDEGADSEPIRERVNARLRQVRGDAAADEKPPEKISSSDIVKLGFVQVSEERNLFDDLSVHENLRMGAYAQSDGFEETLHEVYEMFPVLEERQQQHAGTLSGGEQQMLAIGRGLMAQPDILALDEPSGALAPNLAERVFQKIDEISNEITILLVEQHVDHALELADRAYLLENGRVVTEGTGSELLESDHIRESYLSA